jgi:hypothetical protein
VPAHSWRRESARKDGPEWMIFILMNENATFDTKASLTTPRRGKGEKENPDSMIFILMNENVMFYETALTMRAYDSCREWKETTHNG